MSVMEYLFQIIHVFSKVGEFTLEMMNHLKIIVFYYSPSRLLFLHISKSSKELSRTSETTMAVERADEQVLFML